MADFLMRMAQRTFGLLPVVQPIIASKYAPESMIADMQRGPGAIASSPDIAMGDEAFDEWEETPMHNPPDTSHYLITSPPERVPGEGTLFGEQVTERMPEARLFQSGIPQPGIPQPRISQPLVPQSGQPSRAPRQQHTSAPVPLPQAHPFKEMSAENHPSASQSVDEIAAPGESRRVTSSQPQGITRQANPFTASLPNLPSEQTIPTPSTKVPESMKEVPPVPAQSVQAQDAGALHQSDGEEQFIIPSKEADQSSHKYSETNSLHKHSNSTDFDSPSGRNELRPYISPRRKPTSRKPSDTNASEPGRDKSRPYRSVAEVQTSPRMQASHMMSASGANQFTMSTSSVTVRPASPEAAEAIDSSPGTERKPTRRKLTGTSPLELPRPGVAEVQTSPRISTSHMKPTGGAQQFTAPDHHHVKNSVSRLLPITSPPEKGRTANQFPTPALSVPVPTVSNLVAPAQIAPASDEPFPAPSVVSHTSPPVRSERTAATAREKSHTASPHHSLDAINHVPTTPTVRVTIGRIDVRAVPLTSPASPQPSRPNRSGPTLSLNDYLKQRNGGQR